MMGHLKVCFVFRETHTTEKRAAREEACGVSPADGAQRHRVLGARGGTGTLGNQTVRGEVSTPLLSRCDVSILSGGDGE